MNARGDALVSADSGNIDPAQQLVAAVDVVDADAGLVGDVEAALQGARSGQEKESQQG